MPAILSESSQSPWPHIKGEIIKTRFELVKRQKKVISYKRTRRKIRRNSLATRATCVARVAGVKEIVRRVRSLCAESIRRSAVISRKVA
jgi:hypothetical protein